MNGVNVMAGTRVPTTLGQPALSSTEADRLEYLESGLQPLACRTCGTRVLVKKNSQAHTSVQWTTDAAGSCAEFRELASAGMSPALVRGCSKLRESIEAAVRDGLIEVPRGADD